MTPPPTPATIASETHPTRSNCLRTASSVPLKPPTSTAPRSMIGGTEKGIGRNVRRWRGVGEVCLFAAVMDRVRTHLDRLIARSRVPGLQYLVLDRERPVIEYSGGWADLRQRVPMTADTTMMAYSMSKTITAAAVLQLVGEGKVALDDPLERYHVTPYGPGITVRHLLAHLSGIPNPIPLRWVHAAARHAGFDERAALDAELRAHPRAVSAPGARYRYSNIGYWLLGSVIERASGRPFTAYVAERIFAPLDIPPAALGYKIPDANRHARGYLEKYSIMNLAKRLLIDRQL